MKDYVTGLGVPLLFTELHGPDEGKGSTLTSAFIHGLQGMRITEKLVFQVTSGEPSLPLKENWVKGDLLLKNLFPYSCVFITCDTFIRPDNNI